MNNTHDHGSQLLSKFYRLIIINTGGFIFLTLFSLGILYFANSKIDLLIDYLTHRESPIDKINQSILILQSEIANFNRSPTKESKHKIEKLIFLAESAIQSTRMENLDPNTTSQIDRLAKNWIRLKKYLNNYLQNEKERETLFLVLKENLEYTYSQTAWILENFQQDALDKSHHTKSLIQVFTKVCIWICANILLISLFLIIRTKTSIDKMITSMKNQEQALISNAQLASIGEMSAGIAHEINNPLCILQGKIELTLLKLKDENTFLLNSKDQIQTNLEVCISTILRISKIINSLKIISRGSTPNDPFEKVAVRELFSDVMNHFLERSKKKGIEVFLNISNELDELQLECQRIQVEQIIINSLNNAFDSISNLENPWIKINAFVKDNVANIQFIDSGPGITEKLKNIVFTPFFTTKEVGKGTGIGVSLSKSMAKNQGGDYILQLIDEKYFFVLTIPIHQIQTIDQQKAS